MKRMSLVRISHSPSLPLGTEVTYKKKKEKKVEKNELICPVFLPFKPRGMAWKPAKQNITRNTSYVGA
jgi:hypothetical protein